MADDDLREIRLKVRAEDYPLLERAARLVDAPVTTFMRGAALKEARMAVLEADALHRRRPELVA